MRPCQTCEGRGLRPGTQPERCTRCRGTGQVVFQQGFFRISRPCDACGGEGEVVRERCVDCRGAGRIEGQQSISVRIPAGVEDGSRLRLSGEGEAGVAGGPPGDLYVVISIKPHPLFVRDGPELHCEVPVPFVKAALGSEIEVPTLEGKVTMRIPEGTQSGTVLRLRGKGLPTLHQSARGSARAHLCRGSDQTHRSAAPTRGATRGRDRHRYLAGRKELHGKAARPVWLMP